MPPKQEGGPKEEPNSLENLSVEELQKKTEDYLIKASTQRKALSEQWRKDLHTKRDSLLARIKEAQAESEKR